MEQEFSNAVEKFQAGQFESAEKILLKINKRQAGIPDVLHMLAYIAMETDRPKTAAKYLSQAVKSVPHDAGLFNLLGCAHRNEGKVSGAIEAFSKAVSLAPEMVDAHFNLANALHKVGRLEEAAVEFRRTVELTPDDAEAHFNLGISLKDLGKLGEAVASYHKVLAIKPNYAEAHHNLGIVLNDLGKLDEAVASYHKALAIKPDYVEAHGNLGNALKDLGKLDEAVASYHKVLAIKPNYAEAHHNLGMVLNDLGKLDEAVASYHKALTIKPNYVEVWNNLNFATKALMFSNASEDRTSEAVANGLNDAARATVNFALQQFYLDGFRPHEADESFEKVIAELPAKADEAVSIEGTGSQPAVAANLPDNMVALLYSGRSGTGLLHSLIDGHPEVSTLPSIYLRGYFNLGVWDTLSAGGWRELPERFADMFEVLFDAASLRPIPSRFEEDATPMGVREGMTVVGENRDEKLTLDQNAFCAEALKLLQGLETVDPMSFLKVVHAAFEAVQGGGVAKHTIFYHIHNPDEYAMLNFLRYAPDVRLLMTVREPIQNCESSIHTYFKDNDYGGAAFHILNILFDIDQIAFRKRESVGVRLEDLKARPGATMQSLCAWLGVKNSPSLYEMTAQGKKWWGDPSSPDYDKIEAMSPFDGASTKRPVGTIFSEKDQYVLQTLFYPFSVRFGYQEPSPGQFRKDLKKVRPLLNDMLDFEKTMADRSNIDHDLFKRRNAYLLFRAGLVDRWDVLDELGDYPHMLQPLSIV